MAKDHKDDVEMVDSKGKVTGNIGKDTVVVDGKEIPYQEAVEKENGTDEEGETND
jgi:hypothetical protein